MSDRFDRFTERARKVLALAEQEARRFKHTYIGTEHLLLGILDENEGVGAKVLGNLGVEAGHVRENVRRIVGAGDGSDADVIGLAPRAKRAIESAVEEARKLHHHYIGTEHLLLGLMHRDQRSAGQSVSVAILESFGLSLDQVRQEVVRVLGATASSQPGLRPQSAVEYLRGLFNPSARSEPRDNVVTCRVDDRTLAALDALVEAGVHSTRSEATARLLQDGIVTNRPLLEKVFAAVEEIRGIREQTRNLAEQWKPEETSESMDQPPPA